MLHKKNNIHDLWLKEKIKKIVNDLDPIGIMPYCPKDEYETEITAIYNRIRSIEIDKLNSEVITDIIIS